MSNIKAIVPIVMIVDTDVVTGSLICEIRLYTATGSVVVPGVAMKTRSKLITAPHRSK